MKRRGRSSDARRFANALSPRIEGLGSRSLPSALPGIAFGGGSSVAAAASGTPVGIDIGLGAPTPREVRRQAFRGGFTTRYFVAPPPFTSEARQFGFIGVGGTNQFLHGNLQMAIFPPIDPNGTVTGSAALLDRNNNSSGDLLVALTGSPQATDSAGRPTVLTFTVNGGGGSGGTYSSSVGEGTVTIRYFPGKRTPGRPYHGEAGLATVRFQGAIYTQGTNNPLFATSRL